MYGSRDDVMNTDLVRLSQLPENFLDFVGLSHPDPLDELIALENLKEYIMTKRKNETYREEDDKNLADAMAAANGEDPKSDEPTDDNVVLRLDGTMMTILIHDEAMKCDEFGLPNIFQGMADKCQYMIVNNQLMVEDMMAKARERRDPMSNEKNQIKVESEGGIAEEVDYELTGLSTAQQILMTKLEDQTEQANYLLDDLQIWYDLVSLSDRPLLRRTNNEVKHSLLESRAKKEEQQLALIEQRRFRAAEQMKRLQRRAG